MSKQYPITDSAGWYFTRKSMPYAELKAFAAEFEAYRDSLPEGSEDDALARFLFPRIVAEVYRPDGSVVSDVLTEADWVEIGYPLVFDCLAAIRPKVPSGLITPPSEPMAGGV